MFCTDNGLLDVSSNENVSTDASLGPWEIHHHPQDNWLGVDKHSTRCETANT